MREIFTPHALAPGSTLTFINARGWREEGRTPFFGKREDGPKPGIEDLALDPRLSTLGSAIAHPAPPFTHSASPILLMAPAVLNFTRVRFRAALKRAKGNPRQRRQRMETRKETSR